MPNETELERLVVRLLGDGQQYQQFLQSAITQTKETAKELEGTKIAEGILGAAAIQRAGNMVIGTVREVLHAWEEQENASIALEATLKAQGRQVNTLMDQYGEFASQIQSTTTYADEQVLMLLKSAEAFGLTGKAAEKAVKDSIALAATTGGSASSMMRLVDAMAEGNIAKARLFARFVPELRGVKNETEFLTKYNKLLGAGMEIAGKQARTFGGQMKQLANVVSDLYEDFGKILSEALTPFVQGLKASVLWVKSLSEETKRWIVAIAGIATLTAVTGVFLAIGRAIPFVNLFGVALRALFTPLGLIAAGLAGAGYAFLKFTEVGRSTAKAFGNAWSGLKNEWGATVQGVKDAIIATDLSLAFQIIGLKLDIEWAKLLTKTRTGGNSLLKYWVTFRDTLAGLGLMLFPGDLKEQIKTLAEMSVNELKSQDANIKKMEESLKGLLEKAGKEAKAAAGAAGQGVGNEFTKGIGEGVGKFAAADVRSSEAMARVMDYLDEFGGPSKARGKALGRGAAGAGRGPLPLLVPPAEGVPEAPPTRAPKGFKGGAFEGLMRLYAGEDMRGFGENQGRQNAPLSFIGPGLAPGAADVNKARQDLAAQQVEEMARNAAEALRASAETFRANMEAVAEAEKNRRAEVVQADVQRTWDALIAAEQRRQEMEAAGRAIEERNAETLSKILEELQSRPVVEISEAGIE